MLAQLGVQALKDPAHTQAAQKARAARQQGRHTLPGRGYGGVLYAHEARKIVMDSEQAAVDKPTAALKRAQRQRIKQ